MIDQIKTRGELSGFCLYRNECTELIKYLQFVASRKIRLIFRNRACIIYSDVIRN